MPGWQCTWLHIAAFDPKHTGIAMLHSQLGKPHVQEAFQVIRPYVRQTPVLRSPGLERILNSKIEKINQHGMGNRYPGVRVMVKCENLQNAGSFKFRGAMHSLLQRLKSCPIRQLVTYSTGESIKS